MAGLLLLALIALNALRVRRLMPYLALGLGSGYFVHDSGVHATIAGVLLAFTVPATSRVNAAKFSDRARRLLDDFDREETGDLVVLTSKGQQYAIFGLGHASAEAVAPLLRLEHVLHRFSAFVVMPLFALSNAGVSVGSAGGGVTLAVIAGLVIGKPLGITVAALAAVRLRLASLPDGVNWTALHGCAWLGGIGFTMSLFIAALAFDGTAFLGSGKGRNPGRLARLRSRRRRVVRRGVRPGSGSQLKGCAPFNSGAYGIPWPPPRSGGHRGSPLRMPRKAYHLQLESPEQATPPWSRAPLPGTAGARQ